MLSPKRTKYKKAHRGRLKGKMLKNNFLLYGNFGLQALEPTWLTSRQIETLKTTLIKSAKKTGKIWVKVFPDKPVTFRSAESRMGSGKGSVHHWVAPIRPGAILLELDGLPKNDALKALKTLRYKLPIKTKIISKII